MNFVGFDTSNYTTSVAYFDGNTGMNCSKLLPVKQGELGLRQSDAVFAHTRNLPTAIAKLRAILTAGGYTIAAVGCSATPRDAEGRTRHRYLYFPDEGHWILGRGNAQVWYETFLGFLDEHVRGEAWERPATLG